MSRPRLPRTRRLAAAATVGTLAVGVLAACGSDESAEGSGPRADKADAAQAAAADTGERPLKQGETTTYQNGLKATVSKAEAYELGDYASGHAKGHTPRKVDVTLENTGDERLSASRAQVSARTDDGAVRQIVDEETGVGFHGRLMPGKEATVSYVFDVPEKAEDLDVRLEFVDFGTEPAKWGVEL